MTDHEKYREEVDREIYRPPDAPLISDLPEKAYSHGQVMAAAFLGGPLAGSVLIGSNCALFGSRVSRGQAIFLGILATIALGVISYFVPEEVDLTFLPLAYAFALREIARRYHGIEFGNFITSGGAKYSHWRVVGIAVLCLMASVVALFLVAAVLPE